MYVLQTAGTMLTCPCSEYPLTPHFYIAKLGFTGVFLHMKKTKRKENETKTEVMGTHWKCPTTGTSIECLQLMFLWRNKQKTVNTKLLNS